MAMPAAQIHEYPSRDHDGRPAKRHRITLACTACREKKSKCDGVRPACTACRKHDLECEYTQISSLSKSAASKEYLDGLLRRLAHLEGSINSLKARVTRLEDGQGVTERVVGEEEMEEQINASESPGDDLVEDKDPTDGIGSVIFTKEAESGFFGPSSNISLTRHIVRATTTVLRSSEVSMTSASPMNVNAPSHMLRVSRPPSPNTSQWRQSDRSGIGDEPFVLPDQDTTLRLIEVFFATTGMLFPYIDKAGFIATYGQIKDAEVRTARKTWLGLLNMILAMATSASNAGPFNACERSMQSDMYYRRASKICEKDIRHGTSLEAGKLDPFIGLCLRDEIVRSACVGIDVDEEQWLDFGANAVDLKICPINLGTCVPDCSTGFEAGNRADMTHLVQLLLLMSQYLQGTEKSIETWNLHGLAVKSAYQLGLHSPNSMRNLDTLQRELRTRTWYACIILDRTLSMTMGRPCAIPESFVRLSLPSSINAEANANEAVTSNVDDRASTNFYVSTITLYKIMGEVLELLYGSNIGEDTPEDIYGITSQILRIEQRLQGWKQSVSFDTPLLEFGLLAADATYSDSLRYSVVLTLRFLNLRILTHRPLLCKYLEAITSPATDAHKLTALRAMAVNSLQCCIQSAIAIIRLMRSALDLPDNPQHLLGAWWFSLYYAFNAALIIYATLLLQNRALVHNEVLPIDDWDVSVQTLYEAIDCLSLLSRGNRMAEKCVRYTTALAHILSWICQPTCPAESSLPNNEPRLQIHSGALRSHYDDTLQQAENPFDSTDLHLGMDMNELFSAVTFDNVSLFGDFALANPSYLQGQSYLA